MKIYLTKILLGLSFIAVSSLASAGITGSCKIVFDHATYFGTPRYHYVMVENIQGADSFSWMTIGGYQYTENFTGRKMVAFYVNNWVPNAAILAKLNGQTTHISCSVQ